MEFKALKSNLLMSLIFFLVYIFLNDANYNTLLILLLCFADYLRHLSKYIKEDTSVLRVYLTTILIYLIYVLVAIILDSRILSLDILARICISSATIYSLQLINVYTSKSVEEFKKKYNSVIIVSLIVYMISLYFRNTVMCYIYFALSVIFMILSYIFIYNLKRKKPE